jgi:hypothetical protein
MTSMRRARSEDGCKRLGIVVASRMGASLAGYVGNGDVIEMARRLSLAKEAMCLTHPF